jgi:hypothetical protein
MSPLALFVLFVIYAGIVWRLRGGAFTTLTGIDPGTDGARLGCAVLMGAPLALLHADWRALLLIPAIFIGLLMAGWGPFQGMGTEDVPGYAPEKSWLRWLPDRLGLAPGSYWHDWVGMTQAGVVCVAPSAIVVAWVAHWTTMPPLMVLVCGAAFGEAYTIARAPLPSIPKFVTGQSWGEVFAGMLFGASIAAPFIFN